MVDIMTKPFMKYANETHTGVFEVPLSEQNAILDTGMIKNSTAVRKRIADKNALGEQFGLKPSVFVNPKKVVEVKYGLGLSKEKNREAVYKWRRTEEGRDKYNEYQMELYKKLSANDEWRKKYNERCREANRRFRAKKSGGEEAKKQRIADKQKERAAKEANKKAIGRPPKSKGSVNYIQGGTKSEYKSGNVYQLKKGLRMKAGKGMFDEGINFCDKPYYDCDIFV
jgi:hypothetical protein